MLFCSKLELTITYLICTRASVVLSFRFFKTHERATLSFSSRQLVSDESWTNNIQENIHHLPDEVGDKLKGLHFETNNDSLRFSSLTTDRAGTNILDILSLPF
jgi:hypothetical protein